ncbi:MAG TPA: class I SAM-dependent methyltransferase [Streptosporangiaceae bacterium]|nr:class I SAM-dependent methyltransferase [Streptosporangiaceae bacterium]
MAAVRDDDYDPIAVRRVYDDMAPDYVVRFGSDLAGRNPDTEFLDTAADGFPDGPVVDLGCGPAQVSQYLIGRGRRLVGIDFSPAMLATAATLVPEAGLVAADLLAVPLQDGSCAAVVASYCLHHLPKAWLPGALAGFRRVLRPDGVLVIITHGGSSEELLDRPGGQIVLSRYSPDELTAVLSSAGFAPELIRTRPPRPEEFPAEKVRISARAISPDTPRVVPR